MLTNPLKPLYVEGTLTFDGKFTIEYDLDDGSSSAFRLNTDLGKKIKRAVNSFDPMLEALHSVRNEYRNYVLNDPRNINDTVGSRVLAQIDRAIRRAEEL